jgi:hypothetical protein
MICGFVDTGGIAHHHSLNFLIMINEITLFLESGVNVIVNLNLMTIKFDINTQSFAGQIYL